METSNRREKIKHTISALLSKAEIPNKIVQRQILDDDGVTYLDEHLRHESHRSRHNYDMDEFIGDSIINLAVAHFVPDYFDIHNQNEATIRKHKVQSNKLLGQLAEKYGIVDLILMGPGIKVTEKIKGDSLEALIGCMSHLLKRRKLESTAYIICKLVIDMLLHELHLSKEPKSWKDPFTIYKESYIDFYRWAKDYGININNLVVIDFDKERSIAKVELYGFPPGSNKTKGRYGLVLLGSATDSTDDPKAKEAKKKAAVIAMKTLQEKYRDWGKLRRQDV